MFIKKISLLSLLFFGTLALSQAQVKKKIKYYQLDVIRGLFFQPNTMGPYNGLAFDEHPNGKKKLEAPIKEGKLHGMVREWARNGQKVYETKYENGVQIDKETQWYANGTKSLEIGYLNGKTEGMCLEWHKNGKKKSEGMFRNGSEEGEHNWWYDQNEPEQKAFYKNGLQEGTTKNWYRNGQLKLETPYKNGKREGKVVEYFQNGQAKMEGHFAADVEDKEHLFWSYKGFLLGKKVFDKGTLKREYNYRSASIKTADSYLQVFNQKESFYKVKVSGERVNEINDPANIVYAVDGMLLQMYDIPISSFEHSGDSDLDILNAFVKSEQALIQQKVDKDSLNFKIEITSQEGKTKTNIPYVYWSFESPSSQNKEQKPRTPQEELYVSLLCNKQVLNLYSVVTNSDVRQKVDALLMRIVEQVSLETERIDLNELAQKIN